MTTLNTIQLTYFYQRICKTVTIGILNRIPQMGECINMFNDHLIIRKVIKISDSEYHIHLEEFHE